MMHEKILVVDDEKRIQDLILFRLQNRGVEITSADNGETALKMIHEDPPTLVILDVMMPGIKVVTPVSGIPRQAMLNGAAERALSLTEIGSTILNML